ncbi:MAG: hypothetical protein COB12_02365 [Flavobacterium sp.]|nr:MAG: hypothetical protein COB12_02365 [Flavobacterium sp.]
MKNFFIIFLQMICFNLAIGQVYNVTSFQKINDVNGDLYISLDNDDWFGHAVESIGDLNGDGISDVIVSALQDDDGAFNVGAIYVLFLNSNGAVSSFQKISAIEGEFNGQMEEWDYFGRSLSYLGDINSDGFIEIAVGAEYDGDGGYRHGAVWILSLTESGNVNSYQKISDTQGGFTGVLDVWDVFGSDIANIGDLNNDGNIDIAVGARRDGDGGDERGAVWVLFLNSDFTVNSHQKISDTQGDFEAPLSYKDYFGGSVTNIGDLDNDGVIDLAVGAYRDNDGGINKGAVYILFMNIDGTVKAYQKISETEGDFNETLEEDSLFGVSIDLTQDINGDGKTEIIIGCGNYNGQNDRIGFFYILNLNSDGKVDSFQKYSDGLMGFDGELVEGDFFGYSVSTMIEDGLNYSFIIGAFGDSENGYRKGAAWVIKLGLILSIEDLNTPNNIFLYPNPTRNAFSLSDITNVNTIQVFDMLGREVLSFNSVKSNQFNVAYLPVGEYIINVVTEKGSISSYKLIKE